MFRPCLSLYVSLCFFFFDSSVLIVLLPQFSGVKAYSITGDSDEGRFVSVPTHHQRMGRDRTSIPNISSFFWYPKRVRRYLSRDLYREDSFQAQYVIYYTYSHDVYRDCSQAIESRLLERWYGEILVFRKGRGGGDIISLDRRRGDTDKIIWQVIERYVCSSEICVILLHPYFSFITQYRP